MKARILFFAVLIAATAATANAADISTVQAKDSPPFKKFELFKTTPPQRNFSCEAQNCPSFSLQEPPITIVIPRGTYSMSDLSGTCYTMRTYIVKREPDSDVTHPSGYQTCLPSNGVRFKELKVAPAPLKK